MERIVDIPNSLSWESYWAEWVPHWELRSTKILSQTTQVPYSSLVPEVRGRRVSNVLASMVTQINERVAQTQHVLTGLFHDITLIWDIRDNEGNN